TFVLVSPTPAAITLAVSSDNPGVASVPASVTIPVNGSVAVVPVTGNATGSTMIRVSAPPVLAETTLAVAVFAPLSITLSPVTSTIGSSAPLPIALDTPAPAGGVNVSL